MCERQRVCVCLCVMVKPSLNACICIEHAQYHLIEIQKLGVHLYASYRPYEIPIDGLHREYKHIRRTNCIGSETEFLLEFASPKECYACMLLISLM